MFNGAIRIFSLLALSIASHFSLFALSLAFDAEEAKRAELVLQFSLKPSELGAVIFGGKPLCIEELDGHTLNYSLGHQSTLMGACYRHFLLTWDRIATGKEPFACVKGTTDGGDIVLWINKKAFLSTVREHLDLFQAILGPLMTPEGLLREFLTPGVNPFGLLRSNKVLFGILLGFGKDNSLFHARIEHIEVAGTARVSAPFQPYVLVPVMFGMIPHFCVWGSASPYCHPCPTPGYSSIEQEEAVLVKTCSSFSRGPSERTGRLIPLFGCIPHSQETRHLVHHYRLAAAKTERLLASQDVLPKTLALLLGVSKIDLCITPACAKPFSDQPALHRAVAAALVRGASHGSLLYRQGLMAGLEGIESPSTSKPLLAYLEANYARLAHQNLAASDQFFGSIDPQWSELVPQQLYYRTLKPGTGTPVTPETKTVLISYSITPVEGTSSEDHSYEDTCGRDVQHFLTDLIPGMSHALVGMRPCETREILVHPAHAYGVNSRFEPGVSLRIKVSLRSFRDISEPLCPLTQLSLTLPEIKHDPDECLWALGYAEGAAAWAHLSQASDLIDRNAIIKELAAWDPGNEEDIMTFSHLQVELCRRYYNFSCD